MKHSTPSFALLHQLLATPSPSGKEHAIAAFLLEHARGLGYAAVMDEHSNVFIRKGKPGVVPCVSAHIDTVVPNKAKLINKQGRIIGVNAQGQRMGIGADDKTGVYVCLQLLAQLDDLIVILFAGEEIGGVGARNVSPDWFTDVGYIVAFDCPGRGLVSYTSGGVRLFANDGEFIRRAAPVMEQHGLTKWQHHPFSDVMIIRQRFPISCLNVSSGYHRWHRQDEFIDTEELHAAVESAKAMLKALGCASYPFPVGVSDDAAPRYNVTALKVTEPGPYPASEPKPYGLASEADADDECDPGDSFWDSYMPREVSFFKLELMDRLHRKPYHAVSVVGPFRREDLLKAYSSALYRSDTTLGFGRKKSVARLLFHFRNDLFGYFEDDWFTVYGPSRTLAMRKADEVRAFRKPVEEEAPHFFIINLSAEKPEAQKVTIKRSAAIATTDLQLHYGPDFLAWEERWLDRLMATASGLTVLHGPPGCGKTSYLRALMARLLNKAVFFFVPINAVEVLSSPRFVDFWIGQTEKHGDRHKVAIVEDAEDILLPRDGVNSAKVSNLLNIADGFLGDHLRLHVIATTNATLTQLDKAIVRPGRLTGCREFARLAPVEAKRLAVAQGRTLPEGQADYSLAEIYCGATDQVGSRNSQRVGFAP